VWRGMRTQENADFREVSMAEWMRVVVPSSQKLRFPSMCPACLRPEPDGSLRVRSEKGRLTGFYIVYIKREYLSVTVPFCKECADKRVWWEKLDLALLLIAVMASFALSAWFAISFNAEPWQFWIVFLMVAAISTALCNRLVRDYRAVRIRQHDENTITFAFSRPEYAREFGRLNDKPCQFSVQTPRGHVRALPSSVIITYISVTLVGEHVSTNPRGQLRGFRFYE